MPPEAPVRSDAISPAETAHTVRYRAPAESTASRHGAMNSTLNFEGEVDAINPETERVTIRIDFFGRFTPVELESWQVELVSA